jgi:hypothetical protein
MWFRETSLQIGIISLRVYRRMAWAGIGPPGCMAILFAIL